MITEAPTTAELRAAFNRARELHFRGWTFAKATAVPYILSALQCAAIVKRRADHTPAQPRLI
jgi:hypothetical protein